MSNVTLQIGGRPFTVSAAEGEEEHIEMLGRMIDERVKRMGGAGQSEARMMLFAALILADELHEEHRKAPPPPPEPVAAAAAEVPAEVISRIEALAERVEKLAQTLEQAASAS